MKKSTLMLTICLASLVICISAANLKLANEYNKGHIKNYHVFVKIPSFHHIKQTRSPKNDIPDGNITFIENIDSNGIMHTYYDSIGIHYHVTSDTLYLEPLPEKYKQGYDYNIIVYGSKLQSISTETSNITIEKLTTDSLKIMAKNYTSVTAKNLKVKALSLLATDRAQISIRKTDTIPLANISVLGTGVFSAYNIVFLKKKLSLSPNATVMLAGVSVTDFGVKTE